MEELMAGRWLRSIPAKSSDVSLWILMLTLKSERASFPNHDIWFSPPKDSLTVLMDIFSAQWTTHLRNLLNPFPLTVKAYLTLPSHNTLPVSKFTCAHFPVPVETVAGGKVPHPYSTVCKTISRQCIPLKWEASLLSPVCCCNDWH